MNKALLKEMQPVIERIVEEKLLSLLGDPDEGLKLRPAIRKRLRDSLRNKSAGLRAGEAAKRLGLQW